MTDRRARSNGVEVTRYSSLALRFTVECADPSLADELADLYRACVDVSFDRASAPAPVALAVECEGAEYSLSVDGVRVCERVGRDHVLEWCAWSVNRAAIERTSASSFLLHAAAAADASSAVVLLGPSGSGKSTLAAALALAGLEYMGDDGVALDCDTAAVRSNPKPIAVDDASLAALARFAPACPKLRHARALLAPTSIGCATPTNDAVRVGLIVRPKYRHRSPGILEPMSAGSAAALLVDESFNFETHGPAALNAIATLARRVPAFDLEFDDLRSAVDAIGAALCGSPSQAVPRDADTTSPTRLPAALCVELLDGEAVVWDPTRREFHHLNHLTTMVWSAYLDDGRDGVAAAAERVSREGVVRADDAQAAVEHCFGELAAAGLLGLPSRA